MNYFLSIAASDNSGGAGIQQDLKVAEDLELWGLSAVTGITIQNFKGLDNVFPVPCEIVREQIEKNIRSFPLSAVKIGALCSEENIRTVSSLLKKYSLPHIVLDPVFAPTKGDEFIKKESIALFREEILPCIRIITPNARELSLLSESGIDSFDQAIQEAEKLSETYHCRIFITGGHFEGNNIREAYINKKYSVIFEKPKQSWLYSHGTGCTLSSALACFLAQGFSEEDSCRKATKYVSDWYNTAGKKFRKYPLSGI